MNKVTATVVSAWVVDILPDRLWALGNLYRIFGRDLHFCVGDGHRTIELDGVEIAQGRMTFVDFREPPSDESAQLISRLDLGWIGVAALSVAIAFGVLSRRLTSGRSRGEPGLDG
jgi:hypothetical protein